MKRILSLLLTLVLSPTFLTYAKSDVKTDGDGHVLIKLWQDFSDAQKADRPASAAAVLEKIKLEARRQHLTWDYYDACDRFVQVRTRSNWKLRDSLQKAFRQEIEGFGEPSAVYFMRRGENESSLVDYIKANEKVLRGDSHKEFWDRDWRLGGYKFAPALKPLLSSDWDWCLWSLTPKALMEKEYISYPLKAFMEYQQICQLPSPAQQLEDFAARWKGKAAALLAMEDLLQSRFWQLQDKGSSEDFKALRAECEKLLSEAKAFSGDEKKIAACCTLAENLLESLDSKEVSFSIADSKINLELRNLESVRILIYRDKEKVWEYLQANPICSYYAYDHLQATLPELPDGDYKVLCVNGKTEQEGNWEKYTLSAASRWNADGLGVWATDFRSGKPLDRVDVEILKDGKVIHTVKNLALNAFTNLPKDAQKKVVDLERRNLSLRLRSGNRASRSFWPGSYSNPDLSDRPDQKHCIILTDRSAFQPDESVHFKAILYKGLYSLKTAAGQSLKVSLRDTQGEALAEKNLTTNSFGSVAGEFLLARRERNGEYCITVYYEGKELERKYILVDDFVLPTFDLVFDPMPQLYFPLDSVSLKGTVKAYSGHSLAGADISYRVGHNGSDWASGKIRPNGDRFSLTFPTDSSDVSGWGSYYEITVKVTDVTGETMEFQKWININKHYEVPVPPKEFFFEDIEGMVGVRVVAGKAETWAVAEVYGSGNVLLEKRLLHFSPVGDAPAETTLSWEHRSGWPESVRLNILYFQDKKAWSHILMRTRENKTLDMPLQFERFLDTTSPGAQYSITIKTQAGAEVAATVFDKSTERFMPNLWTSFEGRNRPGPTVWFNNTPGNDSGGAPRPLFYYKSMATRAAGAVAVNAVAEESQMMLSDEAAADFGGSTSPIDDSGIVIREDFATTIAWEPFLKADKNGNVSFSFTNSDKLSTYYVQLFSHDASMRNSALRREMTVTIPVKISLVEPKFLYEGDVWTVRCGLSSSMVGPVEGTLTASFLDGADWRSAGVISSVSRRITVPGGSSLNEDFSFAVPAGLRSLGVKFTFVPDRVVQGADGVFVSVPVSPASQTLTEAHSAVLLHGADRAALEAQLRAAFVNVPGADASLREISILDMIREALPAAIKARGDDAISLSAALYAAALADSVRCAPLFAQGGSASASGEQADFDRADAVSKLLALKGSDGGFAWMKGMTSSPIVTAVVLLRLRGLGIIDEQAAVHFIDSKFFHQDSKRWWFCGLSMQQYLYVRSLFPSVSFNQKTTKEFRKQIKAYLLPSKERGLAGQVAAKARRLATLDALSGSDEGLTLARKLGLRFGCEKRIRKSIAADVASLAEYAETHRGGGVYFPNAVMPWRGLMESELSAHSILCSLMAAHGHEDIAEGVRLWMMLQKETQQWKSDPGFIEALAAVSKASPQTLDTRVLALSATYSKPFAEILKTGNGMGIEAVAPAKETSSEQRIGDRLSLSWTLSSEENRSFVKVTIPFSAGLVPVNQTSGYRWGYYRSVLADRIELWYEAYPEEKITVSEEFYVTRAGSFQSPVAAIECLYAPHYRANTDAPKPMSIASE